WLSLDEGDNDLVCFLSYLQAALQQIAPELGASLTPLLQANPLPPPAAMMTALINDLVKAPARTLLVLDDYHHVHSQAVHEALTFLLENGPPHFHLVLISRADPPLPLARWRVRRELTEVRAADLRFTTDEAAALLNEQMGLTLSADQIAELEKRTEGWIAALQLATLSMQDRDDLASFITSFSGSHHFVLDYLTDEVLQKQPAPRRAFLLRTALLDRFCAPLCAALLPAQNGGAAEQIGHMQQMLEELEQANLFVIRLDDERHWYRYHHLFGEFLRKRLDDELPLAERQELYGRAALWFDAQEQDDEAIQYALHSGDQCLIADLIQKYVQISMGRSELHKILRWLAAMRQAGIELTPRVKSWHAWAMLFSGETEKLAALIADLEKAATIDSTDAREIRGNLAALRGWQALFRGQPAETVRLVTQALADFPADELYIRGVTYLNLGYAYLMQGKLASAVESLREGMKLGERSGNLITEVFARTYLANAQRQQGDLQAAERGYRRAIAQATEHHQLYSPATAVAYIGLSELLREWHQLDEAAALIERACELLQQSRNDTMLNEALSARARTQAALGQFDAALATLAQSDEIALSVGQTMQSEINNATRAWIHLRFGAANFAYRWAAQQRPPDPNSLALDGYRTALALGAIWSVESPTQAQRALEILDGVKDVAQANGYVGIVLQITLQQAIARQTCGEQERALTHLADALAQAEPQGYIHQFVSIGAPMQQLLTQALRRNLHADYVRKLLAAFPTDERPTTAPALMPQLQPLIEPLSERELEVLALLVDGCSNQEIAQRLVIAVGTAKRHLNNIYGKLGVGSRTQAVAQAREIGLA
ncbi:MAG: LuxR C-terminal-related transcriptional regulator, partial [Caldilineaceae bacterium]